MTSSESNGSNVVEVDGIGFETSVSPRVLPIPEAKRGAFTFVLLGVRITNNTQTSFYFSGNFYSMRPEMIAPDGQLMRTGISCERYNPPLESDFFLVLPEKAVTLSCHAYLIWMQNQKKKWDRQLTLDIPFPSQDVYGFSPLYPGTYQFRFNYREFHQDGPLEWMEPAVSQRILENLWTGEVLTPLVDLQLAQP